MVLKINAKLQFCGKDWKIQRCPNKTLVDYQKTIDEIHDKLQPLAEKTRDFQFELTELQDEIDSIDKHIKLLDKLEEPSDDEIRESMKLVREKNNIQKKIHELRKENDTREFENREYYEELDEELRNSYCEFACTILKDFTETDFEEADSTDLTIAPQLGNFYRLATSGAKQKDIDKYYQQIIKDSFR